MKKSLQERVDNLYRLITEADDNDNNKDSDNITIKTLNSLYRSIINK